MNDLLERLGKRVQALRAAKGWSQEEFAHICGLHRTYVGQIERAEKNISFENLTKLSTALGITLAELLSGLEAGSLAAPKRADFKAASEIELRALEVQRLTRRLNHQQAAVQKTVRELEDAVSGDGSTVDVPKKRTAKPKKK